MITLALHGFILLVKNITSFLFFLNFTNLFKINFHTLSSPSKAMLAPNLSTTSLSNIYLPMALNTASLVPIQPLKMGVLSANIITSLK